LNTDEFVLEQAALSSLPAPASWNITYLERSHGHHNNEAILKEECTYLDCKDGLIALEPREKA